MNNFDEFALPVCAYFAPRTLLRGCMRGRIAFVDCGKGCSLYKAEKQEPDPIDKDLWNNGNPSAGV